MPNYHGPSELLMTIQTSLASGSYQDFNAFVRSGIEVGHEMESVDVTGFGSGARKNAVTGIQSHPDIELDVLLDDTGTYALFASQIDTAVTSTGRRLRVIAASAAHTYHINVLTVRPRLVGSLDNLQMLPVTLRPTDEGLWTTSTST